MSGPTVRPIKRLLVANRSAYHLSSSSKPQQLTHTSGEIATRILSTARELSLETYAIYSSNDTSHTAGAAHAIELRSAASYLDIPELVAIAKKHEIDAVHPGYGFLSESAEFSRRLWEEAGALMVGPGSEILERTGDKLRARVLAEECKCMRFLCIDPSRSAKSVKGDVPVCPALQKPTDSEAEIRQFATRIGYPIMVKAVDGGGGRGIRLIRSEEGLAAAVRRAVEESPSRQLFAEKAAVDGFRHVEVQIIGDGRGNVQHLWERECSIQRRYQKVVEIAPSSIRNRQLVARVIEDALNMARRVSVLEDVV